ncbi:MAG: hypothetical protein GX763_00175 [Clostridiaceae bacterium]|nr:hypothetical protein [Clostridiaceae bacterium]
MKAVVLIVENRTAYRERLLSGLQQGAHDYECVAVSGIQEANDLDEGRFNRLGLILAADCFASGLAGIFPGVLCLELTDKAPDEISTNISGANSEKIKSDSADKMHLYLPGTEQGSKTYLSRQSSVSYIKDLISQVLTRPLTARTKEVGEEEKQVFNHNGLESVSNHGNYSLGCLLFFSRSERVKASEIILRSGRRKAHDMLYLPLMPLYDIAYPFRTGSRQTLGDLLLTIKDGRIPDHEKLGSYLYLHRDGYYTFPCPNRADDLISTDRRSLRELIVLLRKYLETRASAAHALIEVSGLTLEKHAMIAALCDYVVIETPTKTTDAALIAQQELAIFLSKLPSSCEIYESSQIKKLSEEAPWFY